MTGDIQGGDVEIREATEVTKPDDTRFVSMDTDIAGLSHVYRASDGYRLRPVTGERMREGFRVTGGAEPEAGG
jgi:hypothetical protein